MKAQKRARENELLDQNPLSLFTVPQSFPVVLLSDRRSKSRRYTGYGSGTWLDGLMWHATRRKALEAARWADSNEDCRPIFAVDVESGCGAKHFAVLPIPDDETAFVKRTRTIEQLGSYMARLPPTRRNLYVIVPPKTPIHPFFDIDGTIALAEEHKSDRCLGSGEHVEKSHSTLQPMSPAIFAEHSSANILSQSTESKLLQRSSRILLHVLHKIIKSLQVFFGTEVAEILILDSSEFRNYCKRERTPLDGMCIGDSTDIKALNAEDVVEYKISYHIHCRMKDEKCFRDLAQHNEFINAFFVDKQPALPRSGEIGVLEAETDDVSHQLVDTGVYSSWRAFRLPFNAKRKANGTNGALLLPHPAHFQSCEASPYKDFFDQWIKNTGLGILQMQWFSELLELFLKFSPRISQISTAQNGSAEHWSKIFPGGQSAHIFLSASLITNPSATLDNFPVVRSSESTETAERAAVVPREPFRNGTRYPVSHHLQDVILRLFQLLHPAFDPQRHKYNLRSQSTSLDLLDQFNSIANSSTFTSAVSRSTAEFEDNGQIRAYYVRQKESKYCMIAGREHKSTYGQLYLTYGSIKWRCYSNDCHHKCLQISWESLADGKRVTLTPGEEPVLIGLSLRDELFPPLSHAELRKRYPSDAYLWPDDADAKDPPSTDIEKNFTDDELIQQNSTEDVNAAELIETILRTWD